MPGASPVPPPFPSAGSEDWHRRRLAAEGSFVPWVESVLPLDGTTVVEFGCGNGAATAAFAPKTSRYLGFDIDGESIAEARSTLAEWGLRPTLECVPPDRILEEVSQLKGEADVFLFYAVLEHMTIEERLTALHVARDVVRGDGIIVIVETPNRLTPWDYHTSQLPFFNQLPEDLALQYLDRSPRPDFSEAMKSAVPAVRSETLARWGRGMSYHELELVYGNLSEHVLASSWETVLFPERFVYREELALQRVLDRARPDLPASFSRYWLDLILAARPRSVVGPMLRPWPLQTTGSVDAGYHGAEVVQLTAADSMLAVQLPSESNRLVVMLDGPDDDLVVRVRQPAAGHEVEADPTPGEFNRVADVRLPTHANLFEVRLTHPAFVTLVAYEA